jgi:hypothetical protein
MSDPFYYPSANEPYIEATMGCVLVGDNLEVDDETLCRIAGPVPVPLKVLTACGDLISAVSNVPTATPAALPLGEQGQWLATTFLTPIGLQWSYMPDEKIFVSGDQFTAKGDLLIGNGCTRPLEQTATALPVGTAGQLLSSDPTAPLGVKWYTNDCYFSQGQKILASGDNNIPIEVGGSTADILLYNSACPAGWAGCFGKNYLVPNCTQFASLVVGYSPDLSSCFYPFPAQNGYVLTSDSFCALNLKYTEPVTGNYQTPGQTVTIEDSGIPVDEWDEIPGTAFPSGSQVFVQTTISMSVINFNQSGYYTLCQGNSVSPQTCWSYYYISVGLGITPERATSISYIIPSWDASCPLTFKVYEDGTNSYYKIRFQTSAFALQP